MPLCEVCGGIDFLNLPPWPRHTLSRQTGVKHPSAVVTISYEVDLSCYGEEELEDVPTRTQVISHHDSLEALSLSTKSCDLCSVIEGEVKLTIPVLEDGHEEFRLRDKSELTGKLYITSRSDLNGFWVLYSIDAGEEYLLLATFGFSVEDGSTFSSMIPGRPVPPDPLSQESLTWMNRSIERCVQSHNHAEPAANTLPSRLLDLEDLASGELTIKLVDSPDPSIRYACLSHCWGSSKQGLTTCKNLLERYKGFYMSELPKTITDAILVARALNLRYLWVDTLCICQDDWQDWEHGAAMMCGVYENAFVTIVAARSSDDGFGFLSPRPQRKNASILVSQNAISSEVKIHASRFDNQFGVPFSTMHGEPWSNRAWTLQERFISRRLVIFGQHQTSFECVDGLDAEDGTIDKSFTSLYLDRVSLGDGVDPVDVENGESPVREALLQWDSILKEYSRRSLTYPSDKFPALSGLASRYAKLICGDESNEEDYLAGLWRPNIAQNLCWFPDGEFRRPSTYRAPSWSWASIESIDGFCYRHSNFYSELAELEDVHIELKGSNPYGEISDAWIQLNATVISAAACDHHWWWGDPSFRRGWKGLVSPQKDSTEALDVSVDLRIDCSTDLVAGQKLPQDLRVLFLVCQPLKKVALRSKGLLSFLSSGL